MTRPIVLCIRDQATSSFVYHAIRDLGVTHVIMEEGPLRPPPETPDKRIRQWYLNLIYPCMRLFSQKRIQELKQRYPLDPQPIPEHQILRVSSVNDARTKMWLNCLVPQLVIFHETSPIEINLLEQLDCPTLTVRPSLTDHHLEIHWAFRTHPDVCEVRIEQWSERGWTSIDRAILYIGGTDNFTTYPYLQLTTAIPLLRRQIELKLQEDMSERRKVK